MSTAAKIETTGPRVVVGHLQRVRLGGRRMPTEKASRLSGDPRPARVALVLALAHSILRAIDTGEFQDQAEAARRFGISRSRATQILDLTLLSARIQDAVLGMVTVEGAEPVAERALRELLRYDSWHLQQAAWRAIAQHS